MTEEVGCGACNKTKSSGVHMSMCVSYRSLCSCKQSESWSMDTGIRTCQHHSTIGRPKLAAAKDFGDSGMPINPFRSMPNQFSVYNQQ